MEKKYQLCALLESGIGIKLTGKPVKKASVNQTAREITAKITSTLEKFAAFSTCCSQEFPFSTKTPYMWLLIDIRSEPLSSLKVFLHVWTNDNHNFKSLMSNFLRKLSAEAIYKAI